MLLSRHTLQTRLNQIVQSYRTWLARPPYHVLLQEHRNRTAELGMAIGKLEEANRRIALLEEQVITSLSRQVAMLDFTQEVMIFVQNAPILMRNGKPWQVKRTELVQRAKEHGWYREPQQEEASQAEGEQISG